MNHSRKSIIIFSKIKGNFLYQIQMTLIKQKSDYFSKIIPNQYLHWPLILTTKSATSSQPSAWTEKKEESIYYPHWLIALLIVYFHTYCNSCNILSLAHDTHMYEKNHLPRKKNWGNFKASYVTSSLMLTKSWTRIINS